MKSLSLHPTSLDAHQALASLRISQCRKEDACSVLNGLIPSISAALAEYRSRNIVDELRGKSMESSNYGCKDFLLFTFIDALNINISD